MQKQQLKQEAAELQQQQQSWSLHVQECDQKYRTWESQRVLVEQQNEATAKQLNQMVQQNQEKIMEEVRKRAGLEQDLRQNEQQEAQLREEIQRQQEERSQCSGTRSPRSGTRSPCCTARWMKSWLATWMRRSPQRR
ncbi:unnamed protein product [Effrenium voratum]|uniref:Uncharacterized protein n=1 Tax=Effrenium voratum TaxID=2562239 RepID=A0AA36IXI1_9DINO|nr:unnamed protein product [Effrenium voratum]